MLMTLETCPSCGGEVDLHEAPGGLCPVCLMKCGAELVNTADLAMQSTPSAGPQFLPPNPLELEADLPDYDVLELIGQGGMGAVYKARHRGLDRIVAIKILPRRDGTDPERAERFAREARALARLKHERIVMAYNAGLTDRYSYFVMEYVDGPNLRQLLAGGALPPGRAMEFAQDVCEALHYAHDAGIVHRDIKPENVLIAPQGRAKLADFGLAKLRDPSDADFVLTMTQQLMGTLHYMAPEQIESPQSADHRADLYGLGVLLYEMLTGELPLGVFDPPSTKCTVDRRVDEIVLKALAKEPSRRFASAADFSAALADLAAHTDSIPPDSLSLKRQTGGRRHIPRRVLIAAGFAAFALAVWGWQFLLKYHKDSQGNVDMTISASGDAKPAADKDHSVDASRARADEAHRKHGLLGPFSAEYCATCHTDVHDYSRGVKWIPAEKQRSRANLPLGDNALAGSNSGTGSSAPSPRDNDSPYLNSAATQGANWANQMPGGLNAAAWSAQTVSPNDAYTLSRGAPSSASRAENPLTRNSADPTKPSEKPARGAGSAGPQTGANLIEITGAFGGDEEKPTEDLPILLSHAVQEGAYPEKSLTLDYQPQIDRIAQDRHYYLVIDGDHIGRYETPIEAERLSRPGKLKVAKMPSAGNGEPLRIYIEVDKPAYGRSRMRASNILKTTVKNAATPQGEKDPRAGGVR
jgi:serine/threonine protein kinase